MKTSSNFDFVFGHLVPFKSRFVYLLWVFIYNLNMLTTLKTTFINKLHVCKFEEG